MGIYVGFDIGGTKCAAVTGVERDGDIRILAREAFATPADQLSAMERLCALAEGTGGFLAALFVGYDPELLALTRRGFLIYSFSFLFAGIPIYGSSFFTALNNGGVSAFIAFLRTCLFQVAAVLILPIFWGIDGVWFSIVAAELLAMAVTVLCLGKYRARYQY